MRIGGVTVDQCIYADLRGKRIVAADARRDQITETVMRTPEKVCVVVCDEQSRITASYGVTPLEKIEQIMAQHPRELYRADTIRELAVKMGMPDPRYSRRQLLATMRVWMRSPTRSSVRWRAT